MPTNIFSKILNGPSGKQTENQLVPRQDLLIKDGEMRVQIIIVTESRPVHTEHQRLGLNILLQRSYACLTTNAAIIL